MSACPMMSRRVRRTCVSIVTVCALPILYACDRGYGEHRLVGDDERAAKLSGIWNITLRLERPLSIRAMTGGLPRDVRGRVAFLEHRSTERTLTAMSNPTNVGVYDIALDSLDLPAWDPSLMPGLAARVVRGVSGHDSISIVVNPETPGHRLKLSGVLAGDAVRGLWLAESPLGGGGTFTLQRAERP